MASKPDRRKREAFAVVTYSNMLTLNALIQLLIQKGVLTEKEILDRVNQLEKQTQAEKKQLLT